MAASSTLSTALSPSQPPQPEPPSSTGFCDSSKPVSAGWFTLTSIESGFGVGPERPRGTVFLAILPLWLSPDPPEEGRGSGKWPMGSGHQYTYQEMLVPVLPIFKGDSQYVSLLFA